MEIYIQIQRDIIMETKLATRKDFREKYTEDEVKEMFEIHFLELTKEEIEEELNIIYHRLDADLSLPILHNRNERRRTFLAQSKQDICKE